MKTQTFMKQAMPGEARATGLLALVLLAAVSGFGQSVNQITDVSPATAPQGTSGLTVTFTLDTDSPPAPPAGVIPISVTLGTNAGSSVTHSSSYTVTAQFSIPPLDPVGQKDAAIVFSTPSGTLTFSKASAFQVTAGSGLAAGFAATPISGIVPLTVTFTNTSTGAITSRLWSFGDNATSTATNPSHTYTNTGSFTVGLTVFGAGSSNLLVRVGYITVTAVPSPGGYVVVDTGQTQCYNDTTSITAPATGQPFYGQDAQCSGAEPSYTLSSDGLTVFDRNTGLTWQRSPDTSGDGNLTAADKLSWANAQLRPAVLNAANYGGYSDWRLPTIKELYSLIDFRGTDPSGLSGTDTSGLTPFINTNYFQFAYGDTSAGERVIDSQYASSTLYVAPDYVGEGGKLFGVNFADGRIKGYGLTPPGAGDKTFFVQCVRGNPAYGLNLFVDNGDQTISDQATGLMWARNDSGTGMNWSNALAWVQARNAARYLGYSDWRLPNAKELQSILDYTRSPDTTASAAIDPVFTCTQITNEANQADYPWYWSGTTHAQYNGSGATADYVCFGRGMGYMSGWVDVHGAGCQRSDPKGGSLGSYTYTPYGYYNSSAPQGDAIRVHNYVRLVRTAMPTDDSVGDGIPNAWRAHYFGGTGTTTNAASCATSDPDHDGADNYEEYVADTNPTNALSRFQVQVITSRPALALCFQSSTNRVYSLSSCTDLSLGVWSAVPGEINLAGTGGLMALTNASDNALFRFFRIGVQLP